MFSSLISTPSGEHLPWYRAKNYRGDLTEREKQLLDDLRSRGDEQATKSDELPADVQGYIKHLEFELEEKRRQSNFNGSAFLIFCAFLSAFASSSLNREPEEWLLLWLVNGMAKSF